MIAYTAYTDLHLNQINLYPPPQKQKLKKKTKKLMTHQNTVHLFYKAVH